MAHISSAVHTRSSCSKVDLTEATCFLCDTHGDVRWTLKTLSCWPILHLGISLLWRLSTTENTFQNSTTEQEPLRAQLLLRYWCQSPWHCICRIGGFCMKNVSSQSSSYLILHTCTRFAWHSWVLILKVASTLPDLKSEHYLCSLISGHICSGEIYLSHSLMILVMFLGWNVILIVMQCI